MRKMIAALSAFALAVPTVAPLTAAEAAPQSKTYKKKTSKAKSRQYRKCRHSPGTAGLIAGGVAGAIAGPAIIGGGLLGTVAGGAAGALGGRAIDRTLTADKRCR